MLLSKLRLSQSLLPYLSLVSLWTQGGKLTTNRAETKSTPDDTELCEIWVIADKETEFYGRLNRNKNLPPIDR